MNPEKFRQLKELERKRLDIEEEIEDNNYDDRGICDDQDPEDWCPEYW
jgi:hypothetical protein